FISTETLITKKFTSTSKECDCGVNSYACVSNMYTEKSCFCRRGYVEVNGFCTECVCGEFSYSCAIDPIKGKMCLCVPGYVYVPDFYCTGGNQYPYTNTSRITSRGSTEYRYTNTPCPLHECLIFIDCYCGVNSYSCVLDRRHGKMCHCHHGYVQMDGYCTESSRTEYPSTASYSSTSQGCYCGANSYSCVFHWRHGKMCHCHHGYVQINGYCSVSSSTEYSSTAIYRSTSGACYCGANSYSCVYDWRRGKMCHCHPGYVQMDGYCFATSSSTPSGSSTEKPKTTTVQDCDCGKNSHSCRYNWFGRKVCNCFFGFVQYDDYCTVPTSTDYPSTASYRSTPRDCYCGVNSYSCVFDWRHGKMCHCHHGYVQMDGYCSATSSPAPSSSSTEKPQTTTVQDCYCGKNSLSCRYDWFGRKVCNCSFGYVQYNDYCTEICNDDKCLHGKCQVIGQGYECKCYEGYVGSRCDKPIELKERNLLLWPAIQVSFMISIFILLLVMLVLLCRQKK
ncbi:EGF-like domain-containing protein, partial [Caerostris darwini]